MVTNPIIQTKFNTSPIEWLTMILDEGKPTLEYYYFKHITVQEYALKKSFQYGQ